MPRLRLDLSNRVFVGPSEPRFPGSTDMVLRMVYVTYDDPPRTRYIQANTWNWILGHGLIVGGSPHRLVRARLAQLPSQPHDGHLSARQVAGALAEVLESAAR